MNGAASLACFFCCLIVFFSFGVCCDFFLLSFGGRWDMVRSCGIAETIMALRHYRPKYFGSFIGHTSDRFRLRIQPIDATVWWNLSAGVSKFNVFLGRSFNLLATALSFACE